jgi:hemerythrin-like domain-containing protein
VRLAEYIAGEHRRIEEALDALIEALRAGDAAAVLERFRAAWRLAKPHLEAEERILFAALRPGFERLVPKMEDQHAQVREAAGAFEVAAGAGSADLFPLGRRFHALLQHHLIEEERDLVALAGRSLEAPLQLELVEALSRGGEGDPRPGC